MRSLMIATLAAAGIAAPPAAASDAIDFSKYLSVWRIGIIGSENEADAVKRRDCLADLITETFSVPVELFPASDYAGVMQGLVAETLEVAGLGPSAYAGIHLQEPDAVEPIITDANTDDSLGYYSVLIVRADSGIETMDDLRGRSLAFADPNSASGYLVPNFELQEQGYRTAGADMFFGEIGFSGGHEQSVIALLNGQYDAVATWISGMGDPAAGYTRGNLRRMVDKGALDMADIRVIWQSSLIANGPMVIRTNLPQEVKDAFQAFMVSLSDEHPECYADLSGGEGKGYVPISHEFYEPIIRMRRATIQSRRG